jgi:hypothetical protein
MFIHHFINDASLCMSRPNANMQLNALGVARPQVSDRSQGDHVGFVIDKVALPFPFQFSFHQQLHIH